MFDNLQKKADGVDDIFAETDSGTTGSPSAKNLNSNSTGTTNQLKASLNKMEKNIKNEKSFENSFGSDEKKGGGIIKKMFVLIIIFVLIGVGAYFVYSKILLPNSSSQTNQGLIDQSQNDLEEEVVVDNETESNNIIDENLQQEENFVENDTAEELEVVEEGVVDVEENSSDEVLKNLDSDSDGLNDYEELYIYKTDLYNPDSDSDGLNDYEEIVIIGTDPLSADTDGDTYFDGQEMLSGYSPLGGGIIDPSLFKDQELFRNKFIDLVEKFNL
ncbi:MAG: hypothetical protein WC164_00415 [Patescibacteria group bacterium]|nr:thrombospondin type 3 repeat-containing protein [Patescibacteria group bacterium]